MAKQYVVESQPEQFLRSQKRHPRLFGRSIAFTLIALYTGRNQVMRSAFAALGPRENMVKRQVLGVLVLAAVLAAIAVANINASPLHRGLAVVPTHMHIMPQPDNRRHRKRYRRRVKHIVAVIFLNKHSPAKIKTHRPRNADSAERFVRKIQ